MLEAASRWYSTNSKQWKHTTEIVRCNNNKRKWEERTILTNKERETVIMPRKKNPFKCSVKVPGITLKQMYTIKYLDMRVTAHGETSDRMCQAKIALTQIRNILCYILCYILSNASQALNIRKRYPNSYFDFILFMEVS